MKTRAAVAYAAGQPLVIEEVDLEGPKTGEVLVEIKATGVCHTDEFTRSGADPEGLFPVIFGHEGAGVVVEVGAGVPPDVEGAPQQPPAPQQTQYRRGHQEPEVGRLGQLEPAALDGHGNVWNLTSVSFMVAAVSHSSTATSA